jgi:CheY-like chemotaxis protein
VLVGRGRGDDSFEFSRRIPDDRDALSERDQVVLIAEPDPRLAEGLLAGARRHGFKAVVTLEMSQLLSLATRFRPDAILLDVDPPGSLGLELLSTLRQRPETADVPIGALSEIGQCQVCLRRGALVHVEKPISDLALNDALARLGAAPLLRAAEPELGAQAAL